MRTQRVMISRKWRGRRRGRRKRVEPPNNPLRHHLAAVVQLVLQQLHHASHHPQRNYARYGARAEGVSPSKPKISITTPGRRTASLANSRTAFSRRRPCLSRTRISLSYRTTSSWSRSLSSWSLKMIGPSPYGYFSDPFNTFDFIIVVVSYVEILINIKGLWLCAASASRASLRWRAAGAPPCDHRVAARGASGHDEFDCDAAPLCSSLPWRACR